ncbi:phage tail protein [Leptolyngbya sp. AN02str]|uniref:phage tail protein n=1 Tax=Leptolyngbya sp. AN02str TaxID=3423363 RepID=UPI003D317719
MSPTPFADPFHLFRFQVDFSENRLSDAAPGSAVPLCSGVFSECTGLEATMEPKVIKAGGHNYGDYQRVGPVTFATVILKRGLTRSRDLWKWFEMTTLRGYYTYRLTVTITLFDTAGNGVLSWELARALPTKFKAPDFNAKGGEVGIEELHFVHEGLTLLQTPKRSQIAL